MVCPLCNVPVTMKHLVWQCQYQQDDLPLEWQMSIHASEDAMLWAKGLIESPSYITVEGPEHQEVRSGFNSRCLAGGLVADPGHLYGFGPGSALRSQGLGLWQLVPPSSCPWKTPSQHSQQSWLGSPQERCCWEDWLNNSTLPLGLAGLTFNSISPFSRFPCM